MTPAVTLADPPADLSRFPALSARQSPRVLFRIVGLRSPSTGALASPWWFSARPPGAARFDLDAPRGTCYWSDRRYGSWVEVFRGSAVVDRVDVTRRALFTASPPPLRLANTLSRAAHASGVTAELSTLVPYDRPQSWARALDAARFAGLVAACRHDPSLVARNVAVFGPAGAVARRRGWVTSRSSLLGDPDLGAELRELGVQVADVPFTVPVTPVPDTRPVTGGRTGGRGRRAAGPASTA